MVDVQVFGSTSPTNAAKVRTAVAVSLPKVTLMLSRLDWKGKPTLKPILEISEERKGVTMPGYMRDIRQGLRYCPREQSRPKRSSEKETTADKVTSRN
ncbi:hypothetical protein Dda_5408 [Drechslerella dactyloides]|uniref:Uncharacterized protein n=1 Tax=Drechslerella dactyloides TaxID=74499 RepID=A0AAD6IW61_DREDA|nr:hypothetical protein Dda_5408 [Drechslerella dactyloides]